MTSTMSTRGSLRAFLSQAKTTLKTAIEKKDQITIVIGNESADLDSITSSIIYAYLQSSQSRARLHIPLLNIPKADIGLRPELLALLPHANIESQHLITLDDLPGFANLKDQLPPNNTRWILVDHNALQGTLGSIYSSRVVGTIDHHADEHKVPAETAPEPRIIETAGSCTSLVVNHCRNAWDALSANGTVSGAAHAQGDSLAEDAALTTLWDAQAAQLALASILIDTHNLTDANKTTSHDERAVALLEAKVNSCAKIGVGFARDVFFDEIDAAKRDLEAIPLEGVLRKDYKQWSEGGLNVGISSAVKELGYLQGKAGGEGAASSSSSSFAALVRVAKGFARERDLAVFAIMTAFSGGDGGFARELLVLGMTAEGRTAVESFAGTSGQELKLEEMEGEDEEGVLLKVWRQGKVAASRKQVAPMIRKAMNEKRG